MSAALIGVVDSRGWLLLQERDELAPVNPEMWSLVGGSVEPGETPAEAARRELFEETGLVRDDLAHLGSYEVPCEVHGRDDVDLFAVRTSITDADVECNEGRQIIFVDPERIADLDLTDSTRFLYQRVLSS